MLQPIVHKIINFYFYLFTKVYYIVIKNLNGNVKKFVSFSYKRWGWALYHSVYLYKLNYRGDTLKPNKMDSQILFPLSIYAAVFSVRLSWFFSSSSSSSSKVLQIFSFKRQFFCCFPSSVQTQPRKPAEKYSLNTIWIHAVLRLSFTWFFVGQCIEWKKLPKTSPAT